MLLDVCLILRPDEDRMLTLHSLLWGEIARAGIHTNVSHALFSSPADMRPAGDLRAGTGEVQSLCDMNGVSQAGPRPPDA
jgi:hypothetical protein